MAVQTGFRSPLGRVRGLGSAKSGAAHWLGYRLLSLALVPLTIWFLASVVGLVGADLGTVRAWIAQPVTAVLLVLTLAVTFHHAANGMQEVFEDYIGGKLAKTLAIAATKGICLLLAAAGIFAVLRIAFAG